VVHNKPSTASTPAKKALGKPRAPQPIDDHIEQMLGKALRAAYADIIEEPVPERFVRLLEDLARADKESG
jgi:hypothetical protein